MFDFFRKKKKDDIKEEEYKEKPNEDKEYDDNKEESNNDFDEYNQKDREKEVEENETLVFESNASTSQEEIQDEENSAYELNHIDEDLDEENQLYSYKQKNDEESLVEDKTIFEDDDSLEVKQENQEENTGFFGRIRDGLIKTRDQFSSQVKNLFTANVKIDEDMYEELEDILISADIGMNTTLAIVDSLRYEINDRNIKDPNEIYPLLEEIMIRHLDRDNLNNDLNIKEKQLAIILVIGVNGVGKTTTIGKLAYSLQKEGKSVMFAAADTFRAAAIEQLGEWASRANVEMVAHSEGADPSAVIFDAIKSAKNKNVDVLICDTAGRLHNKKNLMKELEKINKTIDTHAGTATRENLLVLDATTGQNAVNQLREFKNVTEITGLILTKLDGTAKGGIIFPLQYELNVPVKYIGLGEGIDNLEKFDSKSFVDAMF
ncbi:signal recognition particle-docking protein FtsY [uncultured Anaerococcus sp.]|uniref:signal recognition particle-docking protein FtsY n=1 Tax=uncultured Anaerococcus sp. TaxID=293428 RepID=UPI00261AD467|nr:signal recognition particle-docking protein FtsY [uncultured Anaerococcus sp.]